MAEVVQEGVAPAVESMPPAIAPPEIKLRDFLGTITVVGPDNRKFEVAVNAAANRARAQMTVSKIHTLLDKRLDEIIAAGVVPDILTLKRITETAATLQEMSMTAYEAKNPPPGTGSSDFERFAIGAVKAATEGAVKGMGTFRDREAKIKQLGRKRDTIEVESETVPPEAAKPAGEF